MTLQEKMNAALEKRLTLKTTLRIYTLKRKVITTPGGLQIQKITASTPRTSGKDYTGWGTPRAKDRKGSMKRAVNHNHRLEDMIMGAGWMTPKASDGIFSTPRTSGRPMEKSTHLQTQAIALTSNHKGCFLPLLHAGWPIPTISDATAGARSPGIKRGSAPGMICAAQMASGRATPTVQDHSRGVKPPRPQDTGVPLTQQVGLIGSIAETTNTGQLNPAFAKWLMGYPVQWCVAAIKASRTLKRK